MKLNFTRCSRHIVQVFIAVIFFPFYLFSVPVAKLITSTINGPRHLWGTVPIRTINLAKEAQRAAGLASDDVVLEQYKSSDTANFSYILDPAWAQSRLLKFLIRNFAVHLFFLFALYRYSHFHFFFDGGVLRQTPFWKIEFRILKAAGKKIILLPYGNDSFVYRKLEQFPWLSSLKMDYPRSLEKDLEIEKKILALTNFADIVVGSVVHHINLPRVDIWPVIWFPVWPIAKENYAFSKKKIKILHAANHRNIKGTDYIEKAIKTLSASYPIEFVLLEGKSHSSVMEELIKTDIVIDQLFFGYSLFAAEAMALGKVVLSCLGDESPLYRKFRSDSYLNDCPIISVNETNLEHELKNLIRNRNTWSEISLANVNYVKKYHSQDSFNRMMAACYAALEENNIEKLESYFVNENYPSSPKCR